MEDTEVAESAFERPKKASHPETLWYEVDMLRYSLGFLTTGPLRSEAEKNVYLEVFLLHYRNVLRFFSGVAHRRGSDLSTAEPEVWAGRTLLAEEIDLIRRPAEKLDEKHRYLSVPSTLHHTTDARREAVATLGDVSGPRSDYRSVPAILPEVEMKSQRDTIRQLQADLSLLKIPSGLCNLGFTSRRRHTPPPLTF